MKLQNPESKIKGQVCYLERERKSDKSGQD